MGLISGILMGIVFGIGLMAGWRHMIRYRASKRVAKVYQVFVLNVLGFNFTVL